MNTNLTAHDALDVEWLAYGLQADAAYIADCVLRGDQQAATDHIRKTNYLDRVAQWKAVRGW